VLEPHHLLFSLARAEPRALRRLPVLLAPLLGIAVMAGPEIRP
jgi:hypothetical protein